MRGFTRLTALVLTLVLVLACGMNTVKAATTLQVEVKGTFLYADARKMLSMMNNLRSGKNAWYLAEDNKTRKLEKNLPKLEYDYNLEKVAMQRALEIAVYFSHTRPNGAAWSSLYPGGYSARGENIAYGYGSAASVFNAFAEEKAKYAGQGHRRNMLNRRFTRVGCGAVKVGSVIYWVQEFGYGGSRGSDSNRYKGTKVTVTESILKANARQIKAAKDSMTVKVGESATAPAVVIVSRSGAKLTLGNRTWKATNTKKLKVKNQKVTGLKTGSTKLTTTVIGSKVTVPVSVVARGKAGALEEGQRADLVTIDDYNVPLGDGELFLLEDDECFEYVE